MVQACVQVPLPRILGVSWPRMTTGQKACFLERSKLAPPSLLFLHPSPREVKEDLGTSHLEILNHGLINNKYSLEKWKERKKKERMKDRGKGRKKGRKEGREDRLTCISLSFCISLSLLGLGLL